MVLEGWVLLLLSLVEVYLDHGVSEEELLVSAGHRCNELQLVVDESVQVGFELLVR